MKFCSFAKNDNQKSFTVVGKKYIRGKKELPMLTKLTRLMLIPNFSTIS